MNSNRIILRLDSNLDPVEFKRVHMVGVIKLFRELTKLHLDKTKDLFDLLVNKGSVEIEIDLNNFNDNQLNLASLRKYGVFVDEHRTFIDAKHDSFDALKLLAKHLLDQHRFEEVKQVVNFVLTISRM